MTQLLDSHPIFHSILRVRQNCYIRIKKKGSSFSYTFIHPSNPELYRIGFEGLTGYSVSHENAKKILKIWPIHGPLETIGPELS